MKIETRMACQLPAVAVESSGQLNLFYLESAIYSCNDWYFTLGPLSNHKWCLNKQLEWLMMIVVGQFDHYASLLWEII